MTKAEQFIQDSTRNCHNMIQCFTDSGKPIVTYHHWLLPKEALEAVRIAREEVIEKACEWINNFYSEDRHCFLVKEDIEAFKQAMKEE